MKSLYFTFIAFLFLSTACDKNSDKPSNRLEGTWIVKKYLADPGMGSGRYTDVSGNPSITFHPGSLISSNYSSFGLHMLASYEVIDSNTVRFSFSAVSSIPQTEYRYKFSGDTLILNPPCYEGCGIKLVR